ncbi:MFS transporter [Candidatus Woesearchaeota archaeon]|nr:MFS transporter [Candidatus Woesearchaeota archaeon]
MNIIKHNISKNILLLSSGFAVLFLGYNGFQQYFTAIYSEIGLEKLAFISLALIYIFLIIGNFLAPWIIKKTGAKKALLITGLLYVAFIALTILKIPWLTMAIASILGLAGGVLWTVQALYVVKANEGNNLGQNNGLFFSLMGIGNIAGIMGSGLILEYFSYNFLIILLAWCGLIGVIMLSFLEDKNFDDNIHFSFKNIFADKALWLLIPVYFSLNLAYGFLISRLPIIINQKFGMIDIGILTLIIYVTPILIPYIVGSWSDNNKRSFFMYLASLLGIIGLIIIMFAQKYIVFFIASICFSLSIPIAKPVANALIGDLYHKREFANAIAFFRGVSGIAVPIAIIAGYYMDVKTFLLWSAVLFIISMIPLWLFFKHYHKRMKQEAI